MPTLNINGNILTDTEANWTADSTVYSNKTMLVSSDSQYTGTDQNRFKLANGVDTWANLDYMPIGSGDGGNSKGIITFKNNSRFSPADNQTYYFVQWSNPGLETTESNAKSFSPVDMTIKAATVSVVAGAGSNENVTFEIGVNGVYTAITTTAQITSTDTNFSNFNLNISVNQGDALTVRMVTPTWVSNPINMRYNCNIYFE